GVAVPETGARGGVLAKYIGEGTMAICGAPEPVDDHAVRAAGAALAMVERVHADAGRWAELGFAGMRIGVGVHTGPVVIGTIGSPRRIDYTAIGDTVNVASRIESANKEVDSEILLSAATVARLPPEVRRQFRLDSPPLEVDVKGHHPVRVYRMNGTARIECPTC